MLTSVPTVREPLRITGLRDHVRRMGRGSTFNLTGTSGPERHLCREYAPEIYHPTKWRAWQDFGTGWSGDIGCHIFDAVWKGLDLKPPVSRYSEVQQSWKDSPERRGDTWPQGDHITWMFPGNEKTESEYPAGWNGSMVNSSPHRRSATFTKAKSIRLNLPCSSGPVVQCLFLTRKCLCFFLKTNL